MGSLGEINLIIWKFGEGKTRINSRTWLQVSTLLQQAVRNNTFPFEFLSPLHLHSCINLKTHMLVDSLFRANKESRTI